MKAISPPGRCSTASCSLWLTTLALPLPKLDKSNSERAFLFKSVGSDSTQACPVNEADEASASSTRVMRLNASLQGQLLEPSLEESSRNDEETDYEAQNQDTFVRQAEPFAYWTGRFISLNDKLMNETTDTPRPSVKGGTQLMQAKEEQRATRILDYLEKTCLTPEARRSLCVSTRAIIDGFMTR